VTLEYIQHDYLGAEFGEALCDDIACHTSIGSKMLAHYHNGYGENATPATSKQREDLLKAVQRHPQKHLMRIIIGHAEENRDPITGNSKTIYEYPRNRTDH